MSSKEGFPGGSDGKKSTSSVGDLDLMKCKQAGIAKTMD